MDKRSLRSDNLAMTSVAILIGNADYKREAQLDCCLEDLKAVKALIEAIGRHDAIHAVENADGDAMRKVIRDALTLSDTPDEIFFYFSGHGAQIGAEFYFCGTSFDASRPNETGLSHGELYEFLRAAEPVLLVSIIDACASGMPLVKAEAYKIPERKDGLRNVVQISSCMNSQASWAGDPLSEFTRAFCAACLRRNDGAVYYSDIINTLRDDFLDNEDQTPFFVSQGTGRELLIDDADKLASFRKYFEEIISIHEEGSEDPNVDEGLPIKPPTTLDLLSRAERRMITPEKADRLISSLFDGIRDRIFQGELEGLFEPTFVEHSNFLEETAYEFVGKIMARETRPDDFVSASVSRVLLDSNGNAVQNYMVTALAVTGGIPKYEEEIDLHLNCPLDRVQLKITLNPKFQSLERMVLVLTCAPSLETCYLFEILTQHQRINWEKFSKEGAEVIRRWYKLDWEFNTAPTVEKICSALETAVREHIEATAQRLSGN